LQSASPTASTKSLKLMNSPPFALNADIRIP
jgi:hypothetical protein